MRVNVRSAWMACAWCLCMLHGCASARPPVAGSEAGQLSAQRVEASARSAEARCRLTLIDSAGKQVAFNGVLASRGSQWLRLRTWKFTRPVVDITLAPEGLWVAVGSVVKGSARSELGSSAQDIGRAWSIFAGDSQAWGEPLDAQSTDEDEVHYVSMPRADSTQVLTVVDRKTGRPRRHEVRDSQGTILRTLVLERYRVIDGVAWPHRLILESPRGRIIIDMSAVRLNGEPADDAFVPPIDDSRAD